MRLDEKDRVLLDVVQEGLAPVERPFAAISEQTGLGESEVLERLRRLIEVGLVRSIGAILEPRRLGYETTLCAARVLDEALDTVACAVSAWTEVTHNYSRTGPWNLWFTLVAPSRARIDAIVEALRKMTGVHDVMELPAQRMYKLRVRFPGESPR